MKKEILTEIQTNPRQRIMDTAIRLFFQQGYMATGINQVIQEAGVCKATFYSNFPSKEDLCLEYVHVSHERWVDLLNKEISPHETPYEKLLSVFTFLQNWMSGCAYRGCGLMNIASEVPDTQSQIRDKVQERNQILKEIIYKLVDDLRMSDSRFQRIPVEQMADFLFLIIQGSIVASQGTVSVEPIASAKECFIKLLQSY